MKRDRIVYGVVVIATLVLFIMFQSNFLLWMAIVEIALPLITYILLRMETANLKVDVTFSRGCMAGEGSPVSLTFHGRKIFAALGRVRVVLNYHNGLYGRDVEQEIQIPVSYMNKTYEGILDANMCGEETISCKFIECYGVFDICRVRIKPFPDQHIVVVPRETMTTLEEDKHSWGLLDGEQTDTRKKGNDAAEVYDIREYQNGDDIRSIHWKLSSKVDKILVKEAGYSSHFDTVVLFDAGESSGGQVCSDAVLAGVVDFAVTMSKKMLELPRPHYIGMYLKDTFVTSEMMTLDDLAELVQQNMGVMIQKDTGRALAHFWANNLNDRYSRVIYIVNGSFPDKLYELAEMMQIAAICITDSVDKVTTAKKGKSTFVEIPVGELYEKSHYIYV